MIPTPSPVAPGEPAGAASVLEVLEEHLLVRVGEEWFGVPLAAAEEALEAPELHELPMGSAERVSTVRWRGHRLPVRAASALGGSAAHPPPAVLLLGTSGVPVALAVDEIADVVSVAADRVRPIPGLRDPFGTVHGVTWLGTRLVTVVRTRELIAALAPATALAQQEVA